MQKPTHERSQAAEANSNAPPPRRLCTACLTCERGTLFMARIAQKGVLALPEGLKQQSPHKP